MNAPVPDPASVVEGSGFGSRDSVILVSDGPGDAVRPPRPLLLRLGQAEQQRLALFPRKSAARPPNNPPSLPDENNVER